MGLAKQTIWKIHWCQLTNTYKMTSYSHWMKSNPIKIPRCSRMAWIREHCKQQKGHGLFFEFLWHTRDPELSFISGKKHDGVRLDLHALGQGDHVWLALHGRTISTVPWGSICLFTNVAPKSLNALCSFFWICHGHLIVMWVWLSHWLHHFLQVRPGSQ